MRRGGFSVGVAWPGEPLPLPPPGPGRPPRPALLSAGSVAPPRRAFGGPNRPSRGQGGRRGGPTAGAGPPPAGRATLLAALPVPSSPQHLPGAVGCCPAPRGTGGGGGCSRGGRAEPSAPHSWILAPTSSPGSSSPRRQCGLARGPPAPLHWLPPVSVRGHRRTGRAPRRGWTGRTRPGTGAGHRLTRGASWGQRGDGAPSAGGREEPESRTER